VAKIFPAPLLLLLLAAPATAQAPPSHRVFVAPYQAPGAGGGSGLVAAKFSDGLRADLGGRPAALHLLSEARAPQVGGGGVFAAGGGPGAANLAAARNHVKVGQGLLETGRFEEAMAEIRKALDLFEANLAFVKDETELVPVHLAFAAAAFQAGYEDDGEAALKQALAMQPGLTVSGKGLPPLFQRLTDKFRRRMKKAKRGTLHLTSDPSPATVFVDGKEVGETPLELDDLAPGDHYLRLLRPMSGVWANRVAAPPGGQRVELAVEMPPIGGEAAGTQDAGAADEAAQRSLQELAATLAAGIVDGRLKDRAYELSLRVGATHVVVGLVTAGPTSYRIRTMLLRAEPRALADLGIVDIDPELLELGVRIHEVADRVAAAVGQFPEGALVPDVDPAAPPLVVVAPGPPAPAPPPTALIPPPEPPPADPSTAALAPLAPGPPPGAVPVTGPAVATEGGVDQPPPEPETAMLAPALPVPPPGPPDTEGARWYRRWWVWTTVGIIFAGGATAAVLLLSEPAEEAPARFSTEVRW